MTLEEIQERVNEISKLTDKASCVDSERAHQQDDELRRDFIKYIAQRESPDTQLQEKAKLIASVDDMGFDRWYA